MFRSQTCGRCLWVLGWLAWSLLGAVSPAWAALVAEYRFEETSYTGTASEVVDASGNGNHGRRVNNATSNAGGKTCRGVYVPYEATSTSNAIDTGMDVNTALGNQGSIAFWYKSANLEYRDRALIDATTSSGARFMLARDDNSVTPGYKDVDLTFYVTDANGTHHSVTENQLFADQYWAHIVITWFVKSGSSASNLKMYVDGALVKTATFTAGGGALHSNIGTLFVGDNRSTSSQFMLSSGGYFDNVRFFNHVLTAAEVTTEYSYAPTCTYLHHMEISTSAATSGASSNVTVTIKACATADCTTLYTGGVSGNLQVTGVTPTYVTGQSFTVGATGITTETVSFTAGTAAFSLTGLTVTPAFNPGYWCGLGGSASMLSSCLMIVTAGPHHLRVETDANTGLTCNPTTLRVTACANSDCSSLFTGGVVGTVTWTGAGQTVNFVTGPSFTIPVGSSSNVLSPVVFRQTTAGTITLGATATAPTASNTTTCLLGSSTACTYTNASSALLLNSNGSGLTLRSGNTVALPIQAVQALPSAPNTCVAGLVGLQTIQLSCTNLQPNPATYASDSTVNSLPLTVGAVGLNASGSNTARCDGSSQGVSLTFDSNGLASIPSLGYDDVGKVRLTAAFTGSGLTAGLSLSGTVDITAAPASFSITGVTAGPIKAGTPFSATIKALNSKGVVTKNFGREITPEGIRLAWTRHSPTGLASDGVTAYRTGVLSGSGVSSALTGFASGAVTAGNLSMDEVGYGDLTATLASGNYLSTGMTATGLTGTTGAVGRFIPNQFQVQVTNQGCGGFTYSGQPFAMQVIAQNASGNRTYNFDGTNWANATTLSASGGSGSLTAGQSLAASAFALGRATPSPTFTFSSPLTAPTSAVTVLASSTISGATFTGTSAASSLNLRSGRLRITNMFGSERSSLVLPVQLQNYAANGLWVLNSDDACTRVPVSAIVLDNYMDARGNSAANWQTAVVPTAGGQAIEVVGGKGTLTLQAPQPRSGYPANVAYTGTVDVALNLGLLTQDRSCLRAPRSLVTVGAGLPWLRSQYGSKFGCTGALTWDHDPSARATFGVYSPEARRSVHQVEVP
ncbi:MAG: hypothetical protein RI907_3433 [Pseudomonadota bacterium]